MMKITYMQTEIHTYIKKIWWNIQFIVLIAGQKWCHPHGDEDESEMTKKRVHNSGDMKESRKHGCVYTCCNANDFPQYNCVIFLRQNYNLNIPAVADVLSKWYREIRQKEFIYKELKDGKYCKNVQNCPHSDLFGSNVIMNKIAETMYRKVELIMKTI